MNRTLVRFTGATAIAAAVLALSAPVLAGDGQGRGGHFSSGQRSNGGDRGGGDRAGGNRGGGDRNGGNFSGRSRGSDSGQSSGGSRSNGNGNRGNGGTMNSGGAPRYGNGAVRPGNGGGRYVEGSDRAGNSRYRPPASGNFVMGNRAPNAPTESNLSNSNLPSSAFRSNGTIQRAPGAITHGHFASADRGFDRHYPTPRVPGLPASGGRYNTSPGHSPGFNHRPTRVWYGSRPYWGWNGGYFRGVYWPRAYYRPGFVGFVTLLPPVYSTYWYSGVSYYYANDLYYTWNPDRYGYVVTNPPPVAEDSSGSYSTAPDAADDQDNAPGSLYVYPRNGQSEEQTAQDRFECHEWAVKQTGFDPTMGEAQAQTQGTTAGSAEDYRRAIIACLDGRGYSAN